MNSGPPQDPPSRDRAASTGQPLLEVGDVVAGRFRIVRFIAQGGMGQVYEAEDEELGSHVALKILRPELAGDPLALLRLRREIQLARQVTHRNVCRIFDLIHHEVTSDSGVVTQLTGLSMELLEGETLAEKLAREGSLSTDEALPIIRQMVAALSAAHEAEVVHRDLKTSNVILVPAEYGIRAVVTDFGLARTTEIDAEAASVTGSSAIIGTLAYMAPEQLEGGKVGPAADIYALGLVIYEMVVGSRPFKGRTPISAALQRLQSAPPSPRVHMPGLPVVWETTILRCLAQKPHQRFAEAEAVIATLEGHRPPHRRPRPATLVAIAAGLVVVVAILVALHSHLWIPGRASKGLGTTAAQRPSVAVFGLRNLSGRDEVGWLSTALAEILITELAAGEDLRTIAGETVARTSTELGLQSTESFANDTLKSIRAHIGADFVVVGSYYTENRSNGLLRVSVRVQETETGRTLATIAKTRPENEMLAMIAEAGSDLRNSLGLEPLSSDEEVAVKASLPSSADAARLYAQGLEALRRFDAQEAREVLEQAVQADPAFPLAHSALAAAWQRLGYDARAANEARLAFELSGSLSEEERLLIEGRYREASGRWDEAVTTYAKLTELFPADVEYGLHLARSLEVAGRATQALEEVDRLRRLPSPFCDDPRIAITAASAAGVLSDFRRQVAEATLAIAAGNELGARQLVAQAHLELGAGAWRLGDPDQALNSFATARRLHEEAGDRGGAAHCLSLSSMVLNEQGRLAEARQAAETALKVYRRIGARDGIGGALVALADIRSSEADLEAATALYWQAHEILDEVGDRVGLSTCLNNLAIVRWQRGEFDGAIELFERSLEISRDLRDLSGIATTLNNIAIVFHEQGRLEEARAHLEEVLSISKETAEPGGVAVALNNLGEVVRQEGDLEEALTMYDEALALYRQTQNQEGTETALFNIAEVEREQLRLDEALQHFGESLEICCSIGNGDDEALGLARIAEVLLDRGDVAGAAERLDRAVSQARRTGTQASIGAVLLAKAVLLYEQNRMGEARSAAEEASRTLEQHGSTRGAGMALLVLSQVLRALEQPAEARSAAERAEELFAAHSDTNHATLAAAEVAIGSLAEGRPEAARSALCRAEHRAAISQSRRAVLLVAVTAAQVRHGLGEPVDRRSLAQLAHEAADAGWLCLDLEARILLAGSEEGAAAKLAELAREAKKRGLERLAGLARVQAGG